MNSGTVETIGAGRARENKWVSNSEKEGRHNAFWLMDWRREGEGNNFGATDEQ